MTLNFEFNAFIHFQVHVPPPSLITFDLETLLVLLIVTLFVVSSHHRGLL